MSRGSNNEYNNNIYYLCSSGLFIVFMYEFKLYVVNYLNISKNALFALKMLSNYKL